jgi:hypothetical protein
VAAVAVVAAAVMALAAFPARPPLRVFNPVDRARAAVDQTRLLLDPGQRKARTFFSAAVMQQIYGLDPGTLRLLRDRTVHVDPWEAGVVWAYGLKWDPLPVFQGYSAYTARLDELNATALRGPGAPQRILRENSVAVDPTHAPQAIDGRFPGWDPPAQVLAMFCHYASLRDTARWEVLGAVADRCGAPRRVASIRARAGAPVPVPVPAADQVVFARIHGAEVAGAERLRTLLYRARGRTIVVDGRRVYRLVPGTAADGLLMAAAPGIDFPGPFALSPQARTIAVTGVDGPLHIDFYAMRVRSSPQG